MILGMMQQICLKNWLKLTAEEVATESAPQPEQIDEQEPVAEEQAETAFSSDDFIDDMINAALKRSVT